MNLRTGAATAIMAAALSGLPPSRLAAAQPRESAAPRQTTPDLPADRLSAEATRERFLDLMRDYPPSLAQVLRLDPSLLSNAAYLEPYPGLAAYLAQHPEVAHNPVYFLGEARFGQSDIQRDKIQAIEESLAGLAFFLFFMGALAVLTHMARSILEHRRWLHATKIQTDAHTKLVDRLASNEDLLAYVQSPAGQRFLSVAPMAVDAGNARQTSVGAPVGRILASVQLGVVVACGGAGLWIAKSRVIEEVAQPLHVIAILAVALGAGFVLSALLSYGLSRQMGLLKPSTRE